jgi:hypothetical protein
VSWLSHKLFNDGKTLNKILDKSGDCKSRTLELALRELASLNESESKKGPKPPRARSKPRPLPSHSGKRVNSDAAHD